jgi:hypothetical protein
MLGYPTHHVVIAAILFVGAIGITIFEFVNPKRRDRFRALVIRFGLFTIMLLTNLSVAAGAISALALLSRLQPAIYFLVGDTTLAGLIYVPAGAIFAVVGALVAWVTASIAIMPFLVLIDIAENTRQRPAI